MRSRLIVSCGRSISVVRELPKLEGGVRFPAPAPYHMILFRCIAFRLFYLLPLFLSTGCFTSKKNSLTFGNGKDEESPLLHIVLCWLKEPGNVEHQEKIIEVTKSFREIPGVLDAQAGKAVASDRSIVDDSFDIGILVVVKDKDALEAYLRHPVHDDAKKKILLPLIDRLVVYDFQE